MSLKVIGVGLGRTGTASLKVALEQLGIGRCYHMGEVPQNQGHIDLWIQAAAGNPNWDKLFEHYSATTDYPACNFWRELTDYYPSAKVLLSVRDANRWFESTQETIFAPRFREVMRPTPFGTLCEKAVWPDFKDRIDDREFMVSYFERRVEEIKRVIPKDRLLVYEVKQEWGPLCEFLELPVPDEPFPRINSRDETKRLLESVLAGGSPEEGIAEAAGDLFGDKEKQR